MKQLRGLCVGAGYFSQFHLEAWRRIPEVEIVALCDVDLAKAKQRAAEFGISRAYSEVQHAFREMEFDFIDIATRPEAHLQLVEIAAAHGVAIICQKPLATNLQEAVAIVVAAERANVPLMVHDNFRFQPWHRELKKLIDNGEIGKLHCISIRWRAGDGWGTNAYSKRQPYFRDMQRFLIFETGVHVIDTLRFLLGEIEETYAVLRKLNSHIAGEDAGHVLFKFANGALGTWDANRYNEGTASDPFLTFGEWCLEGDRGSLQLQEDGRIVMHSLGKPPAAHEYAWEQRGFAGDCVYWTQRHFIEHLKAGTAFETAGRPYLKNLAVQESIYLSAAENRPVRVSEFPAELTGDSAFSPQAD